MRATSKSRGIVLLTTPETKSCGTCGQAFPATTEFWHRSGRGLQSRCKECACAYARGWYKSHPERVRINHENSSSKRSAQRAERRREREAAYVAPTRRACNLCHQEFPRTAEFWNKQPRRADGLDETCKTCAKKRARDWYITNKERATAQRLGYRQENRDAVLAAKLRHRAANRDRINAQQRAAHAANPQKKRAKAKRYRLDHPDEVAAKKRADYLANAEVLKQRGRDWAKNNPERVKLRIARRRSAQKNAPGHFTKADLAAQFEKQEGKCFYCHEDLQGVGTIDHYVPLSKGGTNWPCNIVLACWPCNNRKRAKLPSEFRPHS